MFPRIRPIPTVRKQSTKVSTLAKSNLTKTDSIMLGLQSPWPNWDSVLDEATQAPVILLVDEVELNRRLIKALLKTSGYEILESQKPSEALALLPAPPAPWGWESPPPPNAGPAPPPGS